MLGVAATDGACCSAATAGACDSCLGAGAAAWAAGAAGAATATDALTGLLTVRWRGEEGALAAPLPALKEVAGQPAASGTLVYLPPEERRDWDYLLQPDPNRELAGRLLRVFDPRGIFSPGRLGGGARAAAEP